MKEQNLENVPLIKGWDFKSRDYSDAWKHGKLLTAQIENTNTCNCDCEYCFRGGNPPDKEVRFGNEISKSQLINAINEMSNLGVRTINIIGAGEPLMDKGLEGLLAHIAGLGIIPVISTNGSMITSDLVKAFQKYQTSVILKLNSLDPKLQNKLVRRNWFSEKRDYGLKLLLEAGFNQPCNDYRTRLGVNSIVFQENKGEILDILRFCRNHNLMPVMSTFIPAGRTKDRTDQEVSMSEFIEIAKRAQRMDAEEYGIKYERLLPYLGGVPCTQCSKSSIYLTISGDILDCPGQLHSYGNIEDTSITETFRKNRTMNDNPNLSCPPRLDYWGRTNQLVPTQDGQPK
ncbi:MAG: radical SAM protein [Nanoarchaeota archaeon]|nr:radical SAM protein [Nanoarchaeota archaeon]